jgi:hypothetical protein
MEKLLMMTFNIWVTFGYKEVTMTTKFRKQIFLPLAPNTLSKKEKEALMHSFHIKSA